VGTITIRQAVAADAAMVHRLLKDLAITLGKGEVMTSTAADIERFGFGERPHFDALLAFDGDEAVGLAVYFFEFSTWRGRPGVYVQDMYVAPRMRGRGLGRDLMEAVVRRSRERGGRYVKLAVYDGNEQAIGFYRSLGFEVCDDEQVLALRDQRDQSTKE
jgi:ribosomal protein S18 acetylase RimI-like enzyme